MSFLQQSIIIAVSFDQSLKFVLSNGGTPCKKFPVGVGEGGAVEILTVVPVYDPGIQSLLT